MAVQMSKQLESALPELRFQPVLKYLTARLGDSTVAETSHAVLIWEPGRIVPSYAVPESSISVPLQAAAAASVPEFRRTAFEDDEPVLDPTVPFAVHTAPGDRLTIQSEHLNGAAFRLNDADLTGYVVLDFDAFKWWEEDEPLMGHPRDPFHRIDVRRSSREVRITHESTVLMHSKHPRLLFEGSMPMPRYYVPRTDIRVELRPSDTRTVCAYKGEATHYSVRLDDQELTDIAWCYENPLSDGEAVAGLVCFYQERLDTEVNGEPVRRPRTPWS